MKARKKESKCIEILIAEDSPTQAEQLRFLLEEHGYGVVTAGNGKEALMAAVAHKPTLVISDIVMPEMNGYELCKAIKSHEKLKDVPVILVTTLSDPSDVISGLACGADNFIRKSIETGSFQVEGEFIAQGNFVQQSLKFLFRKDPFKI